jgi:hypothetical protein
VKGRTLADGVGNEVLRKIYGSRREEVTVERGAEEDIWVWEGRSNWRTRC